MFEITKITKEEARKIIETKEPLGLFWLIDGDTFISIDNSRGKALVEEFNDKEECLQWLKDWFLKPGDEELYGDRKVCYNLFSNSVRESYDNLDIKAGYDYATVTEKAFNHLQADRVARQRLIMKASKSSYHAEVKRVSELITNMILSGASTEEMEQVIDYSKDVLDTFKYELRCKQSKKDNNIDELVKRYGDEV
ncbi:hypothetical protein CIRMBP1271_00412 [Enterococcus cecorum]|uniref:hypothetical protein n=1 Tax=Enterococcus cecorum TaxID=44008 RepID=UPI000659CF19|nr:hypothetical protein [Enterococcus cecorum]KLO67530.1 hypothetical protein AA985_01120 [Enterococcus cecorum]CAI3255772.1 hypothetical protein CIRMBP1243_00086 [Enterococcus cecorum]CAI3256515.1 hypothetical protein CIRMBP1217_00073 [Enterococcus cecorum]CAI3256791.1 hypothetical protein CIRMBP1226_00101 [Enterococcus cecorum]CAI3257224.1 hypothetical protein CIRMBP1195_00073 [Enterococcus cecorum]